MAETAPLLGNASGLKPATYGEIAKHFGALGWTAFGGPNAHVGMYQELFVNRCVADWLCTFHRGLKRHNSSLCGTISYLALDNIISTFHDQDCTGWITSSLRRLWRLANACPDQLPHKCLSRLASTRKVLLLDLRNVGGRCHIKHVLNTLHD